MALYAMGDFHLSFSVDKPMDVFGSVWKNHVKKIEKYCRRRISEEDTFVIPGDHSWGRNLSESESDLAFIEALPGKKVLLRGNHDMFWEAKKTERLNEMYKDRMFFLQNNFYPYGEYALVGTKGYCYEWKDSEEHFYKIRDREVSRLQISLEAAKAAGFQKFIIFLHYPPTTIGEMESPFTRMAEAYGASKLIYSHSHGEFGYLESFHGVVNGIEYKLVSADYLKFKPALIMDI